MPFDNDDLFEFKEPPVEIDEQTADAIERAIRDADDGRVVSSSDVRKLVEARIASLAASSRP